MWKLKFIPEKWEGHPDFVERRKKLERMGIKALRKEEEIKKETIEYLKGMVRENSLPRWTEAIKKWAIPVEEYKLQLIKEILKKKEKKN